jgi:hypothetical protein
VPWHLVSGAHWPTGSYAARLGPRQPPESQVKASLDGVAGPFKLRGVNRLWDRRRIYLAPLHHFRAVHGRPFWGLIPPNPVNTATP